MLPTIRLNDSGIPVQIAQLLMDYSATDGEYTTYFSSFVSEWQTNHALKADGIIGDATWKAIAENAPTTSVRTLRYGNYAKAVQLLVGAEPDGIFGNKTRTAVIAYQKEHGLFPDGVVGKRTWAMFLCGEEVPEKAEQVQPPNFKQYDSRWAKKMYSNHNDKSQTMKSSACGPTSMADIVAQWWDVNITPYDLALKSMEWGTRTYNSGTSSTFFKRCAELYKAKSYKTSSSIDAVKTCIDNGGYVIVCFGKGTSGKAGYKKWTTGGHYCCIWGYKDNTFFINDPASASASRAKGTETEILNTRKGFYLFEK